MEHFARHSGRSTHHVRGSELLARECGLSIASGWVGLVAQHQDGERMVGLLLPGDRLPEFQGRMRMFALTAVCVVTRPPHPVHPVSEAALLLRQCVRLQLSSIERVKDFLVETYERLSSAGHASDWTMDLAITNQQISELLGISAVHLSRILATLKSRRLITAQGRRLCIAALVQGDGHASGAAMSPFAMKAGTLAPDRRIAAELRV